MKGHVRVSRNRGDPYPSSGIPYRGHGNERRSRVWTRTRLPDVRFLAQTEARSGGNACLACKVLPDPHTWVQVPSSPPRCEECEGSPPGLLPILDRGRHKCADRSPSEESGRVVRPRVASRHANHTPQVLRASGSCDRAPDNFGFLSSAIAGCSRMKVRQRPRRPNPVGPSRPGVAYLKGLIVGIGNPRLLRDSATAATLADGTPAL